MATHISADPKASNGNRPTWLPFWRKIEPASLA